MNLTNKKFAKDYLQRIAKTMDEVSEIDSTGQTAKREIEKATIKVNLIKQANNTFRSSHQHDVARAKIRGYESSFLDEEE